MSNRNQRAQIAKETLQILEVGVYQNPGQEPVSIAKAQALAQANSQLFLPKDFPLLLARRDEMVLTQSLDFQTEILVRNQSSLSAARWLLDQGAPRVLCLNFASATTPGGGFLSGSQAQEESLARASGLYPCLLQHPAYYETHRALGSALYTDAMIYSPRVPVFRDDADQLLEQPYLVSFLTAPAVNAHAIRQNEADRLVQIQPIMRRRIDKVLALAFVKGYTHLVLGAWGCGVFGQRPKDVATYFRDAIGEKSIYQQAFRRILFAVWDRSETERFIRPFQHVFAPH